MEKETKRKIKETMVDTVVVTLVNGIVFRHREKIMHEKKRILGERGNP